MGNKYIRISENRVNAWDLVIKESLHGSRGDLNRCLKSVGCSQAEEMQEPWLGIQGAKAPQFYVRSMANNVGKRGSGGP